MSNDVWSQVPFHWAFEVQVYGQQAIVANAGTTLKGVTLKGLVFK